MPTLTQVSHLQKVIPHPNPCGMVHTLRWIKMINPESGLCKIGLTPTELPSTCDTFYVYLDKEIGFRFIGRSTFGPCVEDGEEVLSARLEDAAVSSDFVAIIFLSKLLNQVKEEKKDGE